jgi:hypothetical protein
VFSKCWCLIFFSLGPFKYASPPRWTAIFRVITDDYKKCNRVKKTLYIEMIHSQTSNRSRRFFLLRLFRFFLIQFRFDQLRDTNHSVNHFNDEFNRVHDHLTCIYSNQNCCTGQQNHTSVNTHRMTSSAYYCNLQQLTGCFV